MRWLNERDIKDFLSKQNYDVRISGNARWIDQKCALDVVTIVSDCIARYAERNPGTAFSSMDIWRDKYTIENVETIFKKPNPGEEMARNEYDKFFQQPMELLAYAGVLGKIKRGNRNFYTINNHDVLEYISIRERNALTFLQLYIEKVLSDSGLKFYFDDFFDMQNKTAYENLKDGFSNFSLKYTKINGIVECNRIFIKVLNPLAFKNDKRGTARGRLSKNKITYDMLMYNRDNFRDIYADKPKELTRRQYAALLGLKPSGKLNSYLSQKAKRLLRGFNDTFRGGKTEVFDEKHISDPAVNIHHIFPEAEFPEICAFLENLIALTPTQHFGYAHPNGNTSRIDRAYQQICLIAKAGTIQEVVTDTTCEQIYAFHNFMYVLFVGLNNETFLDIEDGDFDDAVSTINSMY